MSCEKRDRCETYLLAYLEANLLTFSDNKAISNAELNVSEKPNKNKASVTRWPVFLEEHSSGGKHFHMAL